MKKAHVCVPLIGVVIPLLLFRWLKQLVQKQQQAHENMAEDFIGIFAFLFCTGRTKQLGRDCWYPIN